MGAPLDTPIGPLLQTVFTSILEVFLLCLAGYILAYKGILDKKTQKQLNRLNVSLFTPSLLFSKVAFFLSPAKLRELWIIPLFFIIVTVVSMLVSFLLGTIFRLKRSQRSFAMAASMFMNSNSLPIALMQSLVVTVHGLKWTSDDNKNAMLGRALTYLVLYSTLGMILRWSYGVRLLAQADDPEEAPIRLPGEEGAPLLYSDEADQPNTASVETPNIRIDDSYIRESTLKPTPKRRRSKFYNSFPNSPNQSRVTLPGIVSEVPSARGSASNSPNSSDAEESDSEGTVNADQLPVHYPIPANANGRSPHAPSTTTSSSSSSSYPRLRRLKRWLYRTWVALNEFMTVPLWAALASIIVACVQPLQHALDDHMQPIKGALTSAGNCSIPVTLIVLGAYFYPAQQEGGQVPASDHSQNKRQSLAKAYSSGSLIDNVREMFKKQSDRSEHASRRDGNDEKRPGETKTVIIAVVSRMIITPFLLLPLMALSTKFPWQAVFDDPVFVVSNVLLISSPPALTLAQITQAASGDAFERLISRTIFWAYCIVTPPATILYVVLGLLLSKL